MRLITRRDSFVDKKLLKQPLSEIRQTRSKSGIFKRKKRFSSESESRSDSEELPPVKRQKLNCDKETPVLQQKKSRSLEEKVRLNQKLGTVDKNVKSKCTKKASFSITAKKVLPPGSNLNQTSSRQSKSSKKRQVQPSSESEKETLVLNKDLKRRSRNSINALLDAQLFKPKTPRSKKPTQAAIKSDSSEESSDDDILPKAWVRKTGTKTPSSSTRSRKTLILHSESEDSEDEGVKENKQSKTSKSSRSNLGVFPVKSYWEEIDRESLEEKVKDDDKWETSSTMSTTTRSRSGVLKRKSYAYGDEKVSSGVNQVKKVKNDKWETSSTLSTRSRSGVLKRKSYLPEDIKVQSDHDKSSKRSIRSRSEVFKIHKDEAKENSSQSKQIQESKGSLKTFPILSTRTRNRPEVVLRNSLVNQDVKSQSDKKESFASLTTRNDSEMLKNKNCPPEGFKTGQVNSAYSKWKNWETSFNRPIGSMSAGLNKKGEESIAPDSSNNKNKYEMIASEPKKHTTYNLDIHVKDVVPPRDSSDVRKKLSNTMAEAVKVECKLCSKAVSMTSMRSHTKTHHKMNIADYKANYGELKKDIIKMVYHECGLCGQVLLLDSDVIVMHLRQKHQITHKNYNEKYMQLVQQSSNKVSQTYSATIKSKLINPVKKNDIIVERKVGDVNSRKLTIESAKKIQQPTNTSEKCRLKSVELAVSSRLDDKSAVSTELDDKPIKNEDVSSKIVSKVTSDDVTAPVRTSRKIEDKLTQAKVESTKLKIASIKLENKSKTLEDPKTELSRPEQVVEDQDVVFVEEVEKISKEEMDELKYIEEIFDAEELFDSDEDSSDEN